MSKEIKFTDEELKSLTDLQNKYQDSQIKFGQISVQRLLLNQQLDKLFENEQQVKNEYSEVQQEEAKLVASLSEKYGNGQLDPETGVFTPNS
tara:strand:+ start:720 stop:995 length:276 start_codon:yes stop_codon:yes gene_type:complete